MQARDQAVRDGGHDAVVGAQEGRRATERVLEHRGDLGHQPWLAVVVVEHEDAVVAQVVGDRLERLLGEQERLQAHVRGLADQRQRVRQGEDDDVVLLVGAAQERAAVIDVAVHPWVVVGLVGVVLDADLLDARVDLHRVDALDVRVVGEQQRHVRARPGAHHQRGLEGVTREPLVDLVVERLLLAGHAMESLMRDAVDVDGLEAAGHAAVDHGDAVVGRPDVVGSRLGDGPDGGQDDDHGDGRGPVDARAQHQQDDQGRHDAEPHDRTGGQPRHQPEQRDARQRADDVHGVRLERRHGAEQGTQRHGERRHDRGDHGDGQHEDGVVRVGGVLGRVREPEPDLGATTLDLEVEVVAGDDDDDREQQQREGHQRPAGASTTQQDAQADAQEAGHQQEVAEEADVPDLGRHPADEHQLREQEREAGQPQPGRVAREGTQAKGPSLADDPATLLGRDRCRDAHELLSMSSCPASIGASQHRRGAPRRLTTE
ncbi:MAG: hypothetical protein U0667_02710 [Chloroflexota bacterium]